MQALSHRRSTALPKSIVYNKGANFRTISENQITKFFIFETRKGKIMNIKPLSMMGSFITKINIVIISFVFFGLFFLTPINAISSSYQDSTHKFNKQISGCFEIEKIINVKNAYIIHAVGDDVYFKTKQKVYFTIVSLKSKHKKGTKIRKGRSYKFILDSYYSHNSIRGDLIDHIKIKGVYVHVNSWGMNTYTTENLNGLYYIAP